MDNRDGALLIAEYGMPENFRRRQAELSRRAVRLLPQAERDDRVSITHQKYISETAPRAPRWLFRPDGTVDPGAVDACVYRILYFEACGYYEDGPRRSKQHPLVEEPIADDGPSRPGSRLEEAEAAESRARRLHRIMIEIRVAVDNLPPQHRSDFLDVYKSKKSYKELAAESGRKEVSIRANIARCWRHIRACLGVDNGLNLDGILAELLPEFLRDPDSPLGSDTGEA